MSAHWGAPSLPQMAGKGCAEAHARACSPEAPGGAEAVACVLCRGPGPPPVWARRAGRPGRAQVPEPSWPGAPGPRVPRCPPHAPALASGFPRANGNNGAAHTPGCSEARSPGSGPRRPRCRLSPVSPPPRLSLLSRDSSHCTAGHPRARCRHLETLNAITPAKTLRPRPVTFVSSRPQDLGAPFGGTQFSPL